MRRFVQRWTRYALRSAGLSGLGVYLINRRRGRSWFAARRPESMVFLFLLLIALSLNLNYAMPSDTLPKDPLAEDRNAFLDAVEAVPERLFTSIEDVDRLPGEVLFASVRWQREVLQPDVAPRQQPPGAVEYAVAVATDGSPVAYDLLRIGYKVNGIRLTIYECSGHLYYRVPGASTSVLGDEIPEQLAGLAAMLFQLDEPPRFAPLSSDERRDSYSTHPEVHLESMGHWSDRIDGVSTPETLGIVVHKASLEHDDLFIDLADWFPDRFRQKRQP